VSEQKTVKIDQMQWISHLKNLRTIKIEGEIENVSPLRIGSGKAQVLESIADLTVFKIYDPQKRVHTPVIPGSSLKGVLRSQVVANLRTYGIQNICDGLPRATCLEGNEFTRYEGDSGEKYHNILSGYIKVCLACLIFGSPGFSSHLIVNDGYSLNESKLATRTMVAIDRKSGSVKQKSLYTVEYIEPGAKFAFDLIAFNLPNYTIGLISDVLLKIHKGIVSLGSLKTKGFGQMKFNKVEIYVNGKPETQIASLDPFDTLVTIEDSSVEKKLSSFVNAWEKAKEKISEVANRGWNWMLP